MEYIRECPKCFKEIKHKKLKNMISAKERGSLCRSCCNSGENNPFYKKTHSKESIDKIKLNNILNIDKYRTKEFREKMSKISSNENNPMYGRSFYDVWVSKYGKEVAELKMLEYKKKQSEKNTGSKNNMYGKPSPKGGGNGWSGWYKDNFFKSLKELSCMILFENYGVEFESAESKKFRIRYIDWDGKERNYYPDFFIPSEGKIVECKPTNLIKSKNVECKRIYAEIFCKSNGYIYEIIDPPRLSSDKIKKLYLTGLIKFIDRYDEKFKDRYL